MMSAFSFIFCGRSRPTLKIEFESKWFEKVKRLLKKKRLFFYHQGGWAET
jgi:hypothetical protein